MRKTSMEVVKINPLPRIFPMILIAAMCVATGMAGWGTGTGRAWGRTLRVGDHQEYRTPAAALAAAEAGDTILVEPKSDGTPWRNVTLLVRTPRLSIRGVIPEASAAEKNMLADRSAEQSLPDDAALEALLPKTGVVFDGTGVEYSGRGSVPRAIIQFDPEADGCSLEGFILTGARNKSCNGAGVRINQASDVTIRGCIIRNCDMGIMSNGEVDRETGARQLIERCVITDNGNLADPGYNHNLYLGGTSVTVRRCEIARSVAGHNVKSRVHHNVIEECYIHDSANRELDLVDAAGNTDIPGSNSILRNNRIEKSPDCTGNRSVIHFGRDGSADHDGTLHLIGNTIRTPFISPVVDLSAGRGVVLENNTLDDAGAGQRGVICNTKESTMTITEHHNRLPPRFTLRTGM